MDPRYSRLLRIASNAIVGIVAVGLSYLAFAGPYSVQVAGLALPVHGYYKPLLLLDILVVLSFAVRSTESTHNVRPGRLQTLLPRRALWFAMIAATLIYAPSLSVNFFHHDWTHRHISADLTSFGSAAKLFITRQADGMYRPLTFLSLWLDFRLFGMRLWGYHLQSILIHLLNTLLVFRLARSLRLPDWSAAAAGAFFSLAAVHAEAVIWPAARFDLLASLFTVSAVCCFVEFCRIRTGSTAWASLSLLCYVIAVLTKETGYSFPLLAAGLVFTRRKWDLPLAGRSRMWLFFGLLGAVTLGLLCMRVMLYGTLGGYTDPSGRSIHTAVSFKSLYLLLVNSLGLSLFAINTVPLQSIASLRIVVAASALVLCLIALTQRSDGRVRSMVPALMILLLLSAVPVVNVVGWIRPSMEHSRHLYLPSVWMALIVSTAVHRSRLRVPALAGILMLQAAGLAYNISIYREVFHDAARTARDLQARLPEDPSVHGIDLVKVPDVRAGVLYFDAEVQHQLQNLLPDVNIRLGSADVPPGGSQSDRVTYYWDESSHTMVQLRSMWQNGPTVPAVLQRQSGSPTL